MFQLVIVVPRKAAHQPGDVLSGKIVGSAR